ncbi:MAG TPA: ATP-binding protein, partial [Pyrinomonadaceae bacterium]|nr:ATP-binding protein [Pyrinomonadaceae bacterium]
LRGVNYDITGRKETELEIKHLNHELNRRIKELQAIFDIAPVGIAVALDPSCDVIRANPALAKMLGVASGDNISVNSANAAKVPYKHLKNGRELAPEELPMQRAIAEKRPILGEETEILRADGRLVTLYGYASPVFDEDGNVVSCIAAHIDITERKKGERERERQFDIEQALRKEAEEANRLKDEFLATISHELRTPLNAILGWISILRRDGRIAEDMRLKAFEAIERGAKSQSQLIEDLLDVSRIISGKLQIDVQPIELSSVINAAIETVRPAAEAKGIELQTRIKSSIGLVSGDADRLQQVFWNLLTNAVKFTPKGGRVEVVLQSNDSRVEIIVSDTGKGINPDFLPFVFDRFRQADGSITRHFTGLGLGLSIVKHLVELHGGTVSVTSDGEEKGSTFSVRLPLMDFPDFNEKENKISNTAEGNGFQSNYPALDNVRILIVDDEADTLEILKVVFESCQAEVKTAASAADAFHMLKEWQPQIIISDIGMPEEDGYSFMRRVRLWEKEAKPDESLIPAVALTAYAHADDREKALDSGYQMHVAKPVEPIELASLVESFINS